MKTNELKKGDRILLNNGWYATIADNKKGDIRLAEVEGTFTETGSIYSHDIEYYIDEDELPVEIEYTKSQIKLKSLVDGMLG